MDSIEIKGGVPLHGEVRISGAKNAALPILASSLLVEGTCTFENVPRLKDIDSILLLLEDLGCSVTRQGEGEVAVDAQGLNRTEAAYDLVRKMRASILVLGPLVARLGRARVSLPGGCAIGARPVDLHLKGLEAMGARIRLHHGYVEAEAHRLKGADICFDMPTVGGTENLMMAASLADGETILRNAAREPEIVALADVLNAMGASVQGAGTSKIIIQGVSSLKPVSTTIIPDRIEAGTFLVAGALTGGDVTVRDCNPDHFRAVIDKLRATGASVETGPDWTRVRGPEVIQSVDITTQPYPGFPTDMQAQFMVLLSMAEGTSVISETIFENRFIHVSELQRMGAAISLHAGNTAKIRGVKELSGAPVMASDLRASASLILAGLVATNTTVVHRVYHLDRGYEAIEEKFSRLGARIRRIR
ncbi:UDP-N-acetylglucosamine 1-carboxyvinyltransferase [Desulfobotulus sp.]|jgi:UDP-N-acetylglucosamine 1-carboxyvinyltransferase|uniref:UDP-N-acetylglucosamine 1-carboxyvinyltransferase n=1 Tax=Desulfobotulus sp. TaxID=1940337 RepID=UPI002A366195|nr:UDP-N-acetylglucosamine 1-carboxyvinyltransferase [Desulfobotulus sp.]MDY0163335.1 UDP-N-acetylglucosamine 1-carboxyvinyltransferase [Desulfobotulus sp.]